MKLLLTLLLLSSTAFADEIDLTIPLCKDPESILSKTEIPCRFDPRNMLDFDIPDLELNFDGLNQIFLGAESSGGGRIIPTMRQQNNRPQEPLFNFSFQFMCKARLLLDGQKTVSYLSEQYFSINEYSQRIEISEGNWKHYLIKGNDINSSKRYAVKQAPNLIINNFHVEIKDSEGFATDLCETTTIENTQDIRCSSTIASYNSDKINLTLKSSTRNMTTQYMIEKKLKVNCSRLY